MACTFQATIGGKFTPLIGLSDEDMDMDALASDQGLHCLLAGLSIKNRISALGKREYLVIIRDNFG